MLKYKSLSLLIIIFILINLLFNNISLATEAISVPEKNINLKIENLTEGCKIYLLLSENLLKYNMEQFISNNINNVYTQEEEKAQKLDELLRNSDYTGYVKYFEGLGFNTIKENEIELRHYCFSMQNTEIIGEYEYNNQKYIQIKVNLNDENEFKLIMKDYLIDYNALDTKFMIDDYGTITYIDLDGYKYERNQEKPSLEECNVNYTYYEQNEFNEIQKDTRTAYLILYIVLIIIFIIILFLIIKHYRKLWKEKEERKFWKKKLTKEEKKLEKIRKKEEKKLEKEQMKKRKKLKRRSR